MSWQQKMRWYAGRGKFFYGLTGRYSLHLKNGIYIEVHPDVYEQRFNAYLERLGAQRKSWYGIMQQAETEWQKCCSSAGSRTTWFEMRLPRFRRVSRGLELRRMKNVFTSHYVIYFYSTIENVLRQTFCNVRWSPAFSYWSGVIYPSVECRRIRL